MKNSAFVPGRKKIVWNTKKSNGWEKFKAMTENNQQFMRASELDTDDPNIPLNIINKELNKLKYICFGKVKISSKDRNTKRLETL